MFEDIPQKNPAPPTNLPTEPMDMFSEVEKDDNIPGPSALEAGALKKKPYGAGVQTPPADMASAVDYSVREPVLGKVIMLIIILVIAGGVGYGVWRLYSFFNKADNLAMPKVEPVIVDQQAPIQESPAVEQVEGMPEAPEENTDVVTGSPADDSLTPIISAGIDTDKDGLDDAREEELGTDMNKADTDNDELSDGDEVLIWRTNPLNPDTDGDSYFDGEEIRNGYSPTGPGKLFNGNSQTTSTVSTTSTATTTEPEEEPVI